MSLGAICFTSSGSNGGCWVVLVFPRLFFFLEKWIFPPIRDLCQKKKVYATYTKKKFPSKKKNAAYAKKKVMHFTPKKNEKGTFAYFHNRATLSSHTHEHISTKIGNGHVAKAKTSQETLPANLAKQRRMLISPKNGCDC